MFNRSKSYVAILLGGYPVSTDKVMELIADPNKHLNFIYGFGVFVLYFSSKRRLKTIKEIFTTALKNEVEMIFIFPNDNSIVRYITPRIQDKMNMADISRKNVISNDLSVLKEILFVMGAKYNFNMPSIPYVVENSTDEQQPLTDQQIIDQLLDKMKTEGVDSLSQAEKDFLREYKDKHSKDDQNNKINVD
jgi:hypothetical protein